MNALVLAASLAGILGGSPNEIQVEDRDVGFVEVREPNNPADENGYGSVGYPYRITREQINNVLYAKFLNAVDAEGSNAKALYNPEMTSSPLGGIVLDARAPEGQKYKMKPGYGNRAVVFVNWKDAARFANWLRNGGRRGSSSEVGSYNMQDSRKPERARSGNYWIPSENELYKAGFYLPLGDGANDGDNRNLYARVLPASGLEGPRGMILLRVANGWIQELVDPSVDPPERRDPSLVFAGRVAPEAETGEVGFRIAGALTSEFAEDPEREGDTYAGAPGPELGTLLPFFFGSGAGGSSAPDQSVAVVEPPPAS